VGLESELHRIPTPTVLSMWPMYRAMLASTDGGKNLSEIDFAEIQKQLGTGWSDLWLITEYKDLDAIILTTMRTGVNNWLFIDHVFIDDGLDYKEVLLFFIEEMKRGWLKKIGVQGVGIITNDRKMMEDERFEVLDMVIGGYTDGRRTD